MPNAQIARHKTALHRNELSKPLAYLIADELLRPGESFFDYGCGRGDDVRILRTLGHRANGWDPAHLPTAEHIQSDIVNLGYVINVIEDTTERGETLGSAWSLAEKMLVVSARMSWDKRGLSGHRYGDGIITTSGTFQKFFEHQELRGWIESQLSTKAYAAAPGVFYVFREESVAQQFLASRVYSYRPRAKLDAHAAFSANETALRPLLKFMSAHARPPKASELGPSETLLIRESVGTLNRAISITRKVVAKDHWDEVLARRRSELLIYVALSRFGGRPRFKQLDQVLRNDIRGSFGSYTAACEAADQVLRACGSRALLTVQARTSPIGKQTPTSLYVHRSAVGELSPVLQVYEGCARSLVGSVPDANMVKLHISEPGVSYLTYPTFERSAHPTLATSLKVDLKDQTIELRDYRDSDNPPLLHRKEEFVSADDQRRDLYARLTRSEIRHGLYEHPEQIGRLRGWESTLRSKNVQIRGHRLLRN
ncbi:DNA phosphorothioation-associated putative methyltransferase [Gordonia sputi]|uniref:DNA phosphorothioation-associated methyltransferase n=1 Tax=Gordonia sputi NBRC 100414 TaxID=1089453 RepID=H5U2Y4_9ACTN|nr:DNA phosphorothioation-associated putative methyltransferase [Gordonia sputi]NKY95893.1 DNA phosphorothioation-associated putative methyltransferase [Gordonia sputi]GAB40092.1 hypothetical protein GOSPT_088_00060 [Gordonia sputi NBRC 100414]